MRKLLVAAALFAVVVLPAASRAGHEGCQAVGDGPSLQVTCTYTASGAGTYAAATPNDWEIYVTRNAQKVVLAAGSLAPPSSGAIASAAGELVTVVLGGGAQSPDCVPSTPVCGTVGFVRAGHNA